MDIRAPIPNNVGLESRQDVSRLLQWFQTSRQDW
jgi:hypothetical protein